MIFESTKLGAVHLGCKGFTTPQSLLEVSSGLDMMLNLKQHFDSSVQTGIQTQLAQHYGQDVQRVTARWEGHDFVVGRKALQDFKNCLFRFYIAIDMALNMKWVVKVGDKYYPNPTNLNFCLPYENSTKRLTLLPGQNFISNNKDLIQVSSHERL